MNRFEQCITYEASNDNPGGGSGGAKAKESHAYIKGSPDDPGEVHITIKPGQSTEGVLIGGQLVHPFIVSSVELGEESS